VTAFIVLGKVLSPQFMVWLLPFAAILWAWRERAVALLCAAASAADARRFPRLYFDLVEEDNGAVALVGLRNAVLLVLLAVTLSRVAGPARSPTRSSARRRSAPAPP
jgi:hypothetical protein